MLKGNTETARTRLAGMAAEILPVIARKKMASIFPVQAGWSYLYTVSMGWETDVLRLDEDVFTAHNILEFEHAFSNPDIHMVFVPRDSSVTRSAALRICRRSTQIKTIFYEVNRE